MDMGYVILFLLVAVIALMILWGVYGISPLMILRLVFPGDMSSHWQAPSRKADMEAVYIPVPHTSMNAHTTSDERDITDDYEMPRIGRRLSDDEIITVLATQKGVDGAKYRFSANEIAQIMKGDRNTRLDQVRAVREGPPAPQVREHQARLARIQEAQSPS